MTLAELLTALDSNGKHAYIVNNPEETMGLAHAGTHPDTLIGEMIRAIAEKCGCVNADCTLRREQIVSALGPIRLRFMADDAPVAGFRLVEGSIVAIDKAYNDEALRMKAAAK